MDKFTGRVWVLGDDIDTDIIIPTEYLALKTIDDMKQYGFSPLRPELAGQIQKGDIIVAGKNFGCGSSREHAAWAIAGAGFRVVISSFFADIHKNNELNNLVLPVVVSEEFLKELFESIDKDHKTEVKVDLPNQTVTNLATGKSEHFEINGYKKHCLENGLDDVDFLVQNRDKVEAWEAKNK